MKKYDLIIVGTGFASTFFLKKYLEKTKKTSILVLERGGIDTQEWQVKNKRWSSIEHNTTYIKHNLTNNKTPNINPNPIKDWQFRIAFGGTSSWHGNVPRMMPNDFKTKSLYDIGDDWPVSYEELEKYYCETEKIMNISGPLETPYPMSQPYPLPAHIFNSVDKKLNERYNNLYISLPAARPSIPVSNRPQCCASNVCSICPINSKFTIQNSLSDIYKDKRITLQYGAQVYALDTHNDKVSKVRYIQNGLEKTSEAEIIVLGANAVFNPHILLNSGDKHPWLGKGLGEQVGMLPTVYYDGFKNDFAGSTIITGAGYMGYDGEFRKQRAGFLIEHRNTPEIRIEKDKWTNLSTFRVIIEDIPSQKNYVALSENKLIPELFYSGHSDYAQRTVDYIKENFEKILAPLPVEKIHHKMIQSTESHIQGTVRMGNDPTNSVVDRNMIHHKYRNLFVLGSSAFPTAAAANPTLTIAALSLMTADKNF